MGYNKGGSVMTLPSSFIYPCEPLESDFVLYGAG